MMTTTEKTENPLLKKIRLPGRRFRLPSRGQFYINGEIEESVVDGEVEVFSMTTVDEIALRSPEFLYSGEAIDRVFKRCVPEIKHPLRLLSKDVDFILACLRVVSYGGTYQINTRCPECEDRQIKENKQKIEEFLEEVKVKAEEQNVDYSLALGDSKVQLRLNTLESKQSDEHTYNINLDGILQNNTVEITSEEYLNYTFTLSNGQVIKFTPLQISSAVAAQQFQNNEKTLDLNTLEDYIAFVIAASVQQVDDITDWDMIAEWAKNLPIELKNEIEAQNSQLIEWGTDFTYVVKCPEEECDHERNISTLLNPITFFMTPSK